MTNSNLHCQVITSVAQLKLLQPAWQQLWQQCELATTFQSFEWVWQWCQCYQPHIKQLYIVAIWHEQHLVGLLPCYLRQLHWGGLTQQQLCLLGTAEPESSEIAAEYMDLLCLNDYEAPVQRQLHQQLTNDSAIKAIYWRDIRPQAMVSKLLAAMTAHFPIQTKQPSGWTFAIPLQQTDFDYSSGNQKKRQRLLKKLATLPHQLVIAEDIKQAMELFDVLKQLHQARWQSQGKPGVFSSAVFSQFHQSVLSDLLQSKQLLLAGLQVNQQIIAVNYCFISKKQCLYYQGGIDQQFSPNLSPGLLLHFLLADYARDHGLQQYDLMKSATQQDYKASLAQPSGAVINQIAFRNRWQHFKAKLLQRFTH